MKKDFDVPQSRHFAEAVSCETVLDFVSGRYEIEKHEIMRTGKRDNSARRACLYLLRTMTDMSNGEIAERFQITHSAVAKASARFRQEAEGTEALRSNFAEVFASKNAASVCNMVSVLLVIYICLPEY